MNDNLYYFHNKIVILLHMNHSLPTVYKLTIKSDGSHLITKIKDCDKPIIKDSDKPKIEHCNKLNIKDSDKQNIKDSDKLNINDCNELKIKYYNKLNIEYCNKQNIKDCDKQNIKDCDKLNIKDSDKQNTKDFNKLNINDSDKLNMNDSDMTYLMKWDGSCLGDWSNVQIIGKSNDGISNALYKIKFKNNIMNVHIKYVSCAYMCLIDELKPYFGLIKQGTHWFKRGNSSVIMIKNHKLYPKLNRFIDDICEKRNDKKSKWKNGGKELGIYYPELYETIQEICVFRLISGVNITNLSSICVYHHNKSNKYYGISINELNSVDCFDSPELSDDILSTYFSDTQIEVIAQNICRVRNHRQLDTFMVKSSDHVYNTAKRIDVRLINYQSAICQRILNILDSSFNYKESFGVNGPPLL